MNSTQPTTLKEEVMSLLTKMSDDVTLDEIMHHLYVKRKILKGKEQLLKNESRSQQEVEDLTKEWLK